MNFDHPDAATQLAGNYDPALVALSIVIAIVASACALDIAVRIRAAQTRVDERIWLVAGAVVIGSGVWAMHFTGMLAFRLPVPVRYEFWTTLISILPAQFAGGVALYMVSRQRLRKLQLLVGGALIGVGIGAMHHIGMMAMRMAAVMHMDHRLFAISVFAAMFLAIAALYVESRGRDKTSRLHFHGSKFVSAAVMGLAVASMHYTGMAAVSFYPSGVPGAETPGLGAYEMAVWTGLVTICVIALSRAARIFGRQQEATRLLEQEVIRHKSTEAALRASETRFRDIAEIGGDWIWEMDSDLRFVSISERFFELFSVYPEDIIGKTRDEFAGSADDQEIWRAHVDDLANRRPFRDFRYHFASANGKTWHVLISGKPIIDDDGVFRGYRGTGTDKTAEVEAQLATERSEAQFRALIEGSIQGVFVLKDGQILFANQALARILGYTFQMEILDQALIEPMIAPHERDRFFRYLESRRNGEHAPETCECECLRKDGSPVWMEYRATPIDWRGEAAMQCVAVDITERKRAEDSLQHQNERFNAALENMSQGLCLFDSEQRLVVCNERYASMYGLSTDLMQPGITLREILEQRIANGIFAGADPEAYIEERMAWVTTGRRSSKVQELSDGRAIAIIHQPMPDGGWLTTHEDITERKRSSDLLQAIIDGFPGGIAAFDSDFVLRLANKNYYADLDLPEDVYSVGTRYEDLIRYLAKHGHYGDVDAEEVVRERTALARSRKMRVYERRRKGGRVFELRTFPLPDGGFVSSFIDITERKKGDAVRRRLARIVEDAINEVYVFDAETLRFLQVNASACRNTGRTQEELTRLTPLDINPEFTDQQFQELVASLKSSEKQHLRFQSMHRRKDGSTYDVDIVLQHILSEDRPVFAAIVDDITERRQAERALIEHRDRLQERVDEATAELKRKAEKLEGALAREKELNEMQRHFVSMASHEFRTPLAVIDGSIRRLLRQKDQLTQDDLEIRAKSIQSAVKTMTTLMESTLSAARMDAGKIEVHAADCDLRDIVFRLCARQREVNEKQNLVCDLEGLCNRIVGDEGLLEQVFTNLLSNAAKYSPDGVDIVVKGWCEGEHAVVSIQDRGIGIDEDDLPNLFTRFFRARTSAGIAGTGIGLSLAKTLVELHGGSIGVESRKGEGSIFTVRLPVAGPQAAKREPGAASAA